VLVVEIVPVRVVEMVPALVVEMVPVLVVEMVPVFVVEIVPCLANAVNDSTATSNVEERMNLKLFIVSPAKNLVYGPVLTLPNALGTRIQRTMSNTFSKDVPT